ncbi:MAG: transporter substrate-binding domain-containing protein [Ignavibacteriales bacterium]|nr:transporter substrate-binding domain-containing protein [Ignavibacteriales bacterium]
MSMKFCRTAALFSRRTFAWQKSLSICKLRYLMLFGFLAGIFISSVSASQRSNNDTLYFLGNKNIAPVVYLEGSKPSGVAVDIVRALAKHIQKPIKIKAMDWQEAQRLVAQGEADALIQINQTEERKKIYDFSDPLLESQFSIFVLTDRVGITGISSLRGLRIGVEAGGLPRQLLEKNPHIPLTIIPNFLDGFNLLNEGKLDAVVVDYRVGSYIIAENKIRNIKVTGEPIAYSYSSFAVKKGNTEMLNAINNAMHLIKDNGTYQKIIGKWQPKEVVFHTREQITQMVYKIAIPSLLFLILIAGVWMITLKKELIKRKAAEDKLRKQYSTLSGIINSVNAIVFSVDKQYRYTSFNNRHADIMKMIYGVDIKHGHSLFEYMTVNEDMEKSKRNLDLALSGKQIVEEAYSGEELRTRHYFQVSHSPIKTENEEILGVAVLAQDITERRQAEEEIRQLNIELEKRVADRTAQLEKMNKELETFAYSVSHDLRAPLRSIDGFSQVLLEDYYEKLDEQGKNYLQRVRSAAQRMAQLIDDMLNLSRVSRVDMRLQEINLSQISREIAAHLHEIQPERTVEFVIQEEIKARGDDHLMRIVLENLIGNAWKFTSKHQTAHIEIGLQYQNNVQVFYVRDDGAGFCMDYAQKLFGAFQRLHASNEFSGTGIGLATVQRIIHRHNGEVWAKAEVEKGATFYFTINKG